MGWGWRSEGLRTANCELRIAYCVLRANLGYALFTRLAFRRYSENPQSAVRSRLSVGVFVRGPGSHSVVAIAES